MDNKDVFEFKGKLYRRVGWRKQYGPGTSIMRGIESRGAVLPIVPKPTPAAAKFIAANKESGVVSGAAFNGGGGNYTLADGRSFDLSLADMRSMPMPRWDFGDE